MIKQGVDALVIEGNEAGGHIGPVSTSVLAQEFLLNVTEVPVFVAAGSAPGRSSPNTFRWGRRGPARYPVPSPPRSASRTPGSRRRSCGPRPATPCPPRSSTRRSPRSGAGDHHEGTKDFNLLQLDLLNKVKAGELPREEAQVKLEEFWVGALRRAVVEGDVEHGSLMAGQSVAFVKKIQPVREILDDLVTGAEAALARMAGEG